MGNGIPKNLGFTWEAFCGKFMGNLLVDMGTSVDNLWEKMRRNGSLWGNVRTIYVTYIYIYI